MHIVRRDPWVKPPGQYARLNRSDPIGASTAAAWGASLVDPLANLADPSVKLTSTGAVQGYDNSIGIYWDFSGGSKYLRHTSYSPVKALPFTIFAWINIASVPASNASIITLTANGSTSTVFQLFLENYYGAASVSARQYVGGGTGARSNVARNTGQWYFVAGVFVRNNLRRVHIDRETYVDTATISSPSTLGYTTIGMSPWAGPGEYFPGKIALPCVVNRELLQEEISAFISQSPYRIIQP